MEQIWYMKYAIRYKVYAVWHTVSLLSSLASLNGYYNFVPTENLYNTQRKAFSATQIAFILN